MLDLDLRPLFSTDTDFYVHHRSEKDDGSSTDPLRSLKFARFKIVRLVHMKKVGQQIAQPLRS